MNNISSGKFALCAIALATLIFLFLPSSSENGTVIAIDKNSGNATTINSSDTAKAQTEASSKNDQNAQSVLTPIDIQIIDITQDQDTNISDDNVTVQSTPNIPKTPNIKLSFFNDSITIQIDSANIKSFKLYKSTNSGTYNAVSIASGSAFLDSNVSDGNTYSYKALCTYEDGTSAYSNISSITIQKLKTLNGIIGTSTLNKIQLTWTKTDDAATYTIYRKEDGVLKKKDSISLNQFTDTDLLQNTFYTYVIDARDSKGNRIAISAESTFKTLYIPASLTLKLYSNDEYGVQIAWSTDKDAISYNVYKYIAGKFSLICNTKNNYYIDSDASGSCNYKVSAIGTGGEGELSESVTALAIK